MKAVELFTDGACSGNPGPGGWGAILRYRGHERELSGGDAHTTNNRMELSAVIAGLEQLKEPCSVTLTSDSKYVCDAITKGWARSWKKNGWRKSDKSHALNADLWDKLLALLCRTVADAVDLQFLLIALGHTDDHIVQKRTGQSVKRLMLFIIGGTLDMRKPAVDLDRHFRMEPLRKRSFRPLHGNDIAIGYVYRHAGGDRDLHSAYS